MEQKNILYYSLIAAPLAIIGIPLFVYLPTFYALNSSIDLALIGIILFLARLTDVISDPFIGYLSDKSLKLFNSRKPLIVTGYMFLIVCFYFIINPSSNYPSFWLMFFSICLYFAWSMIQIPYLTFSSEISYKYYIKTKLNIAREISALLGMILAFLIPYIFLSSQETKEVLNLLFISFIILSIPLFAIFLFKLKTIKKETKTQSSYKEFKNIYKLIPYIKYLQIAYFINNLANALPATLFLLFMEFVLNEKDSSGLVLLLYFLSGVIALPFWTLLSKKIGKKKTWQSSIILASFAFFFVIFLEQNDLILFIIISLISGLSLGADLAFPSSIQADLTQRIEKSIKNISGFVFSIWTMITKLALAFAVAIGFVVLSSVGFEENKTSASSINTLIFLYAFLPIILKLISLYFINKFKEND